MSVTIRASLPAGYGDEVGSVASAPALNVLDAAYHAAHGYPGGVAALAVRMGMSANTLNHKLNPNTPTHHLSLAEAMSLQVMTGDVAVLQAMAAALGYTCVPCVADQSGGDPVDAFMLLAHAQGEYMAAAADAMRLDSPSANAVRRVAAAAENAVDATNALLAVLRSRMRKAPGGAL